MEKVTDQQKKSFGRKFWLGLILAMGFMLVSGFLGYVAMTVQPQQPLLGVSTMIGALATGICGIMTSFTWGNIREHQAASGGVEGSPK